MNTTSEALHEAEYVPHNGEFPPGGPPKPESLQTTFPRLLRGLGATVLVASAIAFACQSWSGMDAMHRYYTFFVFTVILSGAGIFCALRLGEAKGARTFFALATAFLPAHFIQLGAFILHQVMGTPPQIHPFFVLKAASPYEVIVALSIALPSLAAVSYAGFSALARVQARLLTVLYLIVNLLLLLPTRDGDLIGLLALGTFLVISGILVERCAAEPLLRNWEGRLAQLLLYSPIACLIARNMVLYSPTALFHCAVATAGAIVLLRGAREAQSSLVQLRLQDLGMISGGYAAYSFVLGTAFNPRFGSIAQFCLDNAHELRFPLSVLPVSFALTVLSLTVKQRGERYRIAASWVAILCVLFQLFTVHGILASLLCILVSVGTIATAFAIEDRGLLYSGGLGFVVGLIYHVQYATTLYAINPWLSLAVPGVAIVLSASYVERRYADIIRRYGALKARIERWA